MGRASQIVEACGHLIEMSKDEKVASVTALVELDREYSGWCFEITFRRVQPDDFDEDTSQSPKETP